MIAALSVYDGAVKVGEIEDRGSRQVEAFAFVAGKRKSVGIFRSRIEAMRAVDSSPAIVAPA